MSRNVRLSPAELEILADMKNQGELAADGPKLQPAPDRKLDRRPVSAAQNVRHQAPLFVALDGLELMKLRHFPGWVRWLFLELCASCDFETGDLTTSYAKLQALMECDQPRQGGQRLPTPSVPQIRRALDDLEAAGMLGRDKAWNMKANAGRGVLFLCIGKRKEIGSSKANRDRGCDRVQKARKANSHRPKRDSAPEVAAGVAAGVPRTVIPLIPSPLNHAELSTNQPAPPVAVDPIALAPGGEKLGPPRGADTRPAEAGHAPPRKVTPFQADVLAGQRGKIGPPRGAETSPDGHAPGVGAPPPSARLRRPTNSVLNGDSLEFSNGSPGNEACSEGSGGG